MATIASGAGGFKKVIIENAICQKLIQRYPRARPRPVFIEDAFDDLEPEIEEEPQLPPDGPPYVAHYRSNLVALSQKENIYFAAYGDIIHCTTPQGIQQTLYGLPELVLEPPRSKEGIRTGGYIDTLIPHCCNHIKVGNLGHLEILLLACDDGDVLAYYTHHIKAAIGSGRAQHQAQPFFHQNVGISAWGLAIHAKSRMIAVSSNHREAVVFKFGCSDPTSSQSEIDYQKRMITERRDALPQHSELFPVFCFRKEDRIPPQSSYRQVLKLGSDGHNIPNIDFSSNENGEADSVVAIDINGTLWILEIDGKHEVRRIPPMRTKRQNAHRTNYVGWGVLTLPLKAFSRTSTPEQAFGTARLHDVLNIGQTEFDVTKTLSRIKDSTRPTSEPRVMTQPEVQIALSAIASLDSADGVAQPARMHRTFQELSLDREDPILEVKIKAHFEALVIKGAEPDRTSTMMNWGVLTHSLKGIAEKDEEAPLLYRLRDRYAILRLYKDEIELMPPVETMPRTLCYALSPEARPRAVQLQPFERFIFQATILELGIVVIGSQAGYAILISLTRPPDSTSQHGPLTTFRLEKMLPTSEEQMRWHEARSPRLSMCPLLGMAVSPLQGQKEEKKRWRLIMQYYDHSVLSYELRREGEKLVVL